MSMVLMDHVAGCLFESYRMQPDEGEWVHQVHVGYTFDDLIEGDVEKFTPFESLSEAIRCYNDLEDKPDFRMLRLCLTTRKRVSGFVLQREINFMRRHRCTHFAWELVTDP